jgi:hypothetical protein
MAALVLLTAATPGVALGAEATDGGITVQVGALPAKAGQVAEGTRYEQPPVSGAPAATGTEAELNEGGPPPVPPREDGVAGQGIGEPTIIAAPGAQGDPTPQDLIYATQPVVATDTASSTAEPQVAVNGDRMLVTWNWGVAQSSDGGATFTYLDPFTHFPSAGDGFCCDQLAAYVPEHDLWVWILQYLPTPGPTGSNVLRVAVAQGDGAFDMGSFTYYDLTAQEVGMADGVWLDQPKIGWTDDALFVSVNGFRPLEPDGDGQFEAAAIWRMPFDDLISGNATSTFITTDGAFDAQGRELFGPYPIRDSGDTMYLAAHIDQATLGVISWPDGAPDRIGYGAITSRTDTGEPLVYPLGTERYTCPADGGDPETSDWCAFSDERITAGWRRGDIVGWAWNVSQSEAWGARYPWVFATEIDLTRIDRCADGSCVVGHPAIWLADQAVQYPVFAVNARGDLGGAVLAGGGANRLGCVALVRAADAPPDAAWEALTIARSDADSPEPRSGDYLGVAPYGDDQSAWTVTCMTLLAGSEATKTQVHVASFGRRSDVEQ